MPYNQANILMSKASTGLHLIVALSVQWLTISWMVWSWNPGGGEIFHARPNWPWGPPSLMYSGYQVLTVGYSGWGMALTTHPLLVPRVWISTALLHLCVFMASYMVNLAFTSLTSQFIPVLIICNISNSDLQYYFSYFRLYNAMFCVSFNFQIYSNVFISCFADWTTVIPSSWQNDQQKEMATQVDNHLSRKYSSNPYGLVQYQP